MTEDTLIHLLALVGTIVYVSVAVPATVKIIRERSVDPATAHTLGMLVLAGVWWTIYSWEIRNWPSFISSALSLIAPTLGLATLWRHRSVQWGLVAVVAAGLLVVILELHFRPLRAVGLTAAIGSAMITVPMTYHVLRSGDRSVAGTSLGMWVLMAVGAAVWLTYAILIDELLLGASGAIQLPCSLIVIERVLHDRRAAATSGGGADG